MVDLNSLRLPALSLGLLVAVGIAGAAEIRWGGGHDSNMVSPAAGLPDDLSTARLLWDLPVGTHQYSLPTLAQGRLYVGTNDAHLERPGLKPTGGGLLQCYELATKELLWQFVSPRNFDGVKPPFHYNHWKCGYCSGPLVDGDRVYVVGSRGEVQCLDIQGQRNGNQGPVLDELEYWGLEEGATRRLLPTDGDLLWRYDLLTELGVVPHDVCGSTLLMVDDLLYACTSNGLDDKHAAMANPKAPSLIALNKRTGKLVATEQEGISERTLHGQWSSPVAARVEGAVRILFGGGDGVLYAFEPPTDSSPAAPSRLKKVWEYDCNPPDYRFENGQPVPYSRYNKKSPKGPSEIIGTPVVYEGCAYVAIGQSPIHGEGQGILCCVEVATGQARWTSRLVARTLATPSVSGGLLFIVDYSGNLHCFDAATGERYWVHDLESNVWGSSTLVADGKVYVGTEKRVFFVFRAARHKELLSTTQLKAIPITPVAAEGVLYVPTQKRLLGYGK